MDIKVITDIDNKNMEEMIELGKKAA